MPDPIVPDPAAPATPTATPAATPTPTTPAATPAIPADPSANLNALLLHRLTAAETRAAELEAADRQRQAEAARREQDALAARGDADAAQRALAAAREAADRDLTTARAETDSERMRARNAFRDRELALALAAHPIHEGVAPQLMALLRNEVEAHPEGDAYAVRTRDFVPVGEFVTRQLARPEFAHFLRPTSTGGAGAAGTHHAAGVTPPADPAERMVAKLKEQVAAGMGSAPGLDGTYGRGLAAATRNN